MLPLAMTKAHERGPGAPAPRHRAECRGSSAIGVSKCGDRQGSAGDVPWAAAFAGQRAPDTRAVSRPRMTAVFRQLVEELDHEH